MEKNIPLTYMPEELEALFAAREALVCYECEHKYPAKHRDDACPNCRSSDTKIFKDHDGKLTRDEKGI